MFIIKISSPTTDMAADPNIAKLKAYLAQNRLANIRSLKGKIAKKEKKTGFTNYSAHVFDAAEYYANGLSQVSQLDAQGAFNRTDFITKKNIEATMAMAAKVSFASAFAAAMHYNTKNIRQYNRQKMWEQISKLGF